MKAANSEACEAWELLLKFFFSQRADLPALAGGFDLSPAQCHVLHLIQPGKPVPMGRLAETLACHASNVTGLVDRLEAGGLGERRLSEDDRRIKVLKLTREGVHQRAQILKRMTSGARPLTRLSPRQQHALVRI